MKGKKTWVLRPVFMQCSFGTRLPKEFPNLNEPKAHCVYAIEGKQLGLETKPRSGASLQGVADLREISKFVIGILKDEKSFLESLEHSPEKDKLNLF